MPRPASRVIPRREGNIWAPDPIYMLEGLIPGFSLGKFLFE